MKTELIRDENHERERERERERVRESINKRIVAATFE